MQLERNARASALVLLLAVALLAACSREPVIVEITATPVPTSPPTPTPAPPTFSVCASGCDFTTIQAALDDPGTTAGSTIEVNDPIHTEDDIVVEKNVTIQGQGPDDTIVQAHEDVELSTGRVFAVTEGATVTIRRMTIRHGNPDWEPRIGFVRRNGGGVANRGTLTLEDVVIRDNIASKGGGIVNSRATMTLIRCSIIDNETNGIEDAGLQCGAGGGIYNVAAVATFIDSTISGNTSLSYGGAIKIGCNSVVTMTNTTISGNTGAYGGAIDSKGTLTLYNCTIVDNVDVLIAGGICNRGVLNYANTIIANNSGGPDCVIGTFRDGRFPGSVGVNANNLVGDGGCEAAFAGDPLLGPLADNGGATWTHALLPGSPAIDAAPCTLDVDQRGVARLAVSASDATPCDLGAYEVDAATTP
jgi:hypothetical protein